MDRFIVREARTGTGFSPGQMIAYAQNPTSNNMIPEGVYYEGQHGSKFPGMQLGAVNTAGFMGIVHANPSPYAQAGMNVVISPGQGQYVSGIDPTYLTAYSTNSAAYIANGGMAMNEQTANQSFSAPYQNRNYVGVDRNKSVAFSPQATGHGATRQNTTVNSFAPVMQENIPPVNEKSPFKVSAVENIQPATKNSINVVKPKQERDTSKNPEQTLIVTRADRLKAIHKSGPRAFSGPVEKVLKWHKALQDIGITVIYEIVAKCVNVKAGDSCAKHLVIRDENGPAMQVDYYEVDFLLPELKPPCTVRVVGRILAGTCRLQAFNVRAASGDDVAMLPRRAAVAAHHVAKLCNEFNVHLP